MSSTISFLMDQLKAEGYQVRIDEVLKNGIAKTAIIVGPCGGNANVAGVFGENANLSGVFYENDILSMEKHGVNAEQILAYIKDKVVFPIDLSDLPEKLEAMRDKQNFLDNTYFRMVKAGTEDAYKEYPHFMWQDIPVIYYVEFTSEARSNITYTLAKAMGCTEDELYQAAFRNMQKRHEKKITEMNQILANLIPSDELEKTTNMNVIGDRQLLGAASILIMQDELEGMAEKYGGITLIPSSIHEWIIVNGSYMSAAELNQMIKEVNQNVVDPDEQLSDHAYMITENLEILQAVGDEWINVTSAA